MSYEDLPQILRTVAQVIDSREEGRGAHGLEHRRLTTIRRLLAGERLDAGLLNYNLESVHVGVAVTGPAPTAALEDLRARLNSRLLLVRVGDDVAWAWLGGNYQSVQADLKLLLTMKWPHDTAVACGATAEGLGGWRLTHRQALAALPIAQHGPTPVVHHPAVALLATALHDDLLSSSLRQAYLDPLEQDRDGGLTAKHTLRAYFKACRNASSAAAELRVDRSTVSNRLKAIEDRLGHPPEAVSAELEVALRLDEITNQDGSLQDLTTC
ncbi:MAG TPA: helix-turn-helix domain-containing protein [Solirubrobacterales bacterium]|nr:helix-turn-helix domain-containing protein [Solirubrobacterales bacterium]